MRKIALVAALSLPCAALAASDCRVLEYDDHYEVTCVGGKDPSTSEVSPPTAPQVAAAPQPPGAPLPGEEHPAREGMTIRSELARRQGAYWLSRQQRR